MTGIHDRLVFGCARIRGGLEERRSRKLLERALHCGIRWFDTAPIYGDGQSERILGDVFKDCRGEVFLVSKVGLEGQPVSKVKGALKAIVTSVLGDSLKRRLSRDVTKISSGESKHFGVFEPELLVRSLNMSLELLKTDRLDALLLHEPPLIMLAPEFYEQMTLLHKKGLFNEYGVGTGGGFSEIPVYGSISQFSFFQGSGAAAFKERTLCVHGLFRNLSASRLDSIRNIVGKTCGSEVLHRLLERDQDVAAALVCLVAAAHSNIRVVFSTSSEDRLIALSRTAVEVQQRIDSGDHRLLEAACSIANFSLN